MYLVSYNILCTSDITRLTRLTLLTNTSSKIYGVNDDLSIDIKWPIYRYKSLVEKCGNVNSKGHVYIQHNNPTKICFLYEEFWMYSRLKILF